MSMNLCGAGTEVGFLSNEVANCRLLRGSEEMSDVTAQNPSWSRSCFRRQLNVAASNQKCITATDPPSLTVGSTQQQNLPAATFARHAMNTLFQITKRLAEWPFDLRGTASMAIFRRWQTLSSDPARAAEIINLMWTDLAASAVVGTRGVQGPGNSGETSAQVLVRPIGNRITYDLRFSIPACLLVGSMAVILLTALGSTCCSHGGFKTLRRRIGQLSLGRVFTTYLYPEESTLTMLAKEWRLWNRRKTITVNVVAKRGAEQYRGTRSGDSPGVDTINLIGAQKARWGLAGVKMRHSLAFILEVAARIAWGLIYPKRSHLGPGYEFPKCLFQNHTWPERPLRALLPP